MNLYLDIETIPSLDPLIQARLKDDVKPPAALKKAESIAEWHATQGPAALAEAHAKTGLDGAYGHALSIAWAVDDGPVQCLVSEVTPEHNFASAIEAERDFINGSFGEIIADVQGRTPVLIGHNVAGFDVRFLFHRAVVLGAKLPRWWPIDARPWDTHLVYDTQVAWAGARGFIGLGKLADILGFEATDDIPGKLVAEAWREGRTDDIVRHNKADVEKVREVHKRIAYVFE